MAVYAADLVELDETGIPFIDVAAYEDRLYTATGKIAPLADESPSWTDQIVFVEDILPGGEAPSPVTIGPDTDYWAMHWVSNIEYGVNTISPSANNPVTQLPGITNEPR